MQSTALMREDNQKSFGDKETDYVTDLVSDGEAMESKGECKGHTVIERKRLRRESGSRRHVDLMIACRLHAC